MILCESVLFGVIMGCFSLGSDVKALDVIVGRVKERVKRSQCDCEEGRLTPDAGD